MRYFLELSYNGLGFHGWQSQPNARSVQSEIERALSTVLRKEISITGAGRTDAGVHARQMFAHFDTENEVQDFKRLKLSLNSLLGKNIFIKRIFPVNSDAHARFDAIERCYKYFVSFEKNPFQNEFFWRSPTRLDFSLMNEAAKELIHTHDFTSFAKLHSDVKTNICNVRIADWSPLDKDIEGKDFLGNLDGGWVFTIAADRFLRNMVRAIVGTLVEVGRKKISIEEFKEIIRNKNRNLAGTSMSGHALFLWKIQYPFNFVAQS